ncbi:MAG: helix-turn-helix transcriptional regulator [Alphaproteobacteria bacterium]
MLTPEQIRAGRALINAKQSDLAKRAGISLATLNNIERATAHPRGKTWAVIADTFEQEGIEIFDDAYGFGVRLKTNERAKYTLVRDVLERVVSALKIDFINPLKQGCLVFSNDPVPHYFLWLDFGVRNVIYDSAKFTLADSSKSQELAGLILAFKSTNIPLNFIDEVQNIQNISAVEAIEKLKKAKKTEFDRTYDILKNFDNTETAIDEASSQDGHLLTHLIQKFGGF